MSTLLAPEPEAATATATDAAASPAPGAATPPATTPAADAAPKPATEQKAGEAKKDGEKATTEKDKAGPKAAPPDKYDLKLPEGSALDASAVEGTASIAKELGLSNEHAQKLLEHQSKLVQAHDKAVMDAHSKRIGEWETAVKADKELGGPNLAVTQANLKRVSDRFFTPQLKADLNSTGFGNYPEFVRLISRIGAAMADDKLVQPGAGQGGERSVAEVLYPDQSKS